MKNTRLWLALLAAAGCGDDNTDPFGSGTTSGGTTAPVTTVAGTSSTSTTSADDSTTGSLDTETGSVKLDIFMPDLDPFEPPEPTCKVADGDMDAVGDCGLPAAPPDSFEPVVQWSWDGPASIVTPLVANLTEDNGDGEIDLCDTPDVVVLSQGLAGTIHVLDGGTGNEHFSFGPVHPQTTPAIGDIDGDGEPEIVATRGGIFGPMAFVAFDTDGTELWVTDAIWEQDQGGAVAIADMDNDGSPEIIGDGHIVSADGTVLFSAPAQTGWPGLFAQRNTASDRWQTSMTTATSS